MIVRSWHAFVIATLSWPHATVGSQTRLPTPRPEQSAPSTVTVALIDVTVVEALEALSQLARINLVWQATSLGDRATLRIACRYAQVAPEVVLACITRRAGLDYVRLSSGTYVVIAAAENLPAFAAFRGIVVDAITGAPLPSARVQLAEEPIAVLSQDDGGFSFPRLRPGRYAVSVRAVGYSPFLTSFDVESRVVRTWRFPLQRIAAFTRPLIVNGIRPGIASSALGNDAPSARTMDRLIAGPALFLPGAVAPLGVSRRDGTGDLHLQGGDIGEHPWRLDGVPLYDVAALSGLLGIVTPAVVQRMTVRRSGFRAADGSFTTGVLDLEHAVDPTNGTAQAEAAIDPLAASARVIVPLRIAGIIGDIMVAGRTGLWPWTAPQATVRALRLWSTPDPVLLARLTGFGAVADMEQLDQTLYASRPGDERVSLHDAHVATRLSWGVAQQLDASAFVTSRGVSFDGIADDVHAGVASLRARDSYAWRTTGGQLSHRWLLGTRVRQHVQLRASSHSLQHDGSMQMLRVPAASLLAREDNGMSELAVAANWRITAGPRLELFLGSELARTTAHLDLANRVLRPIAYKTSVVRGTGVADATIVLNPQHHLDAGVRITQLQNGRTYAEPRVAVRGERTIGAHPLAWRIAGGGYQQFVNQFDVASTMPVAFVPSLRFWLPSNGAIPVARSWHLASEGVLKVASGWELRAEGYARWQPSIPMIDYGAMYGGNGIGAPIEAATEFVTRSSGRALGAGIRVIRDASVRGIGVRSELAYDAGTSLRRFPSRFDGAMQPTPWTEPHRAFFAIEVRPARAVVLAARTRGVWGRPWSLRQAYYDLFGAAPMQSGLPIGMPGAMQRPAIVDLDLGASLTRRVGRVDVEFGVSLTNALNRANVLDFSLRRRSLEGGYDMVPRRLPGRQPAFTVQVRP